MVEQVQHAAFGVEAVLQQVAHHGAFTAKHLFARIGGKHQSVHIHHAGALGGQVLGVGLQHELLALKHRLGQRHASGRLAGARISARSWCSDRGLPRRLHAQIELRGHASQQTQGKHRRAPARLDEPRREAQQHSQRQQQRQQRQAIQHSIPPSPIACARQWISAQAGIDTGRQVKGGE